MKRTVRIKTKAYAEDESVETTLTLDLTELTENQIVDLAVKSLVIERQAKYRRDAMKEIPIPIPTEDVWLVGIKTKTPSKEKELLKMLMMKYGSLDKALEAMESEPETEF